MNKAFSTFAALLVLASVAAAGPQIVPLVLKVGTTNTQTTTVSGSVQGYVDEVYVQVPSPSTSEVTVVSAPAFGSGLASVVLWTNATQTASARARTRIMQTDNAGVTNGAVTERYLSAGDTVTLTVKQAASGATGATYRAWLKLTDAP